MSGTKTAPPPPDVAPTAPSLHLWPWELRALPALIGGLVPRPNAAPLPRGHGAPVLLLPGFGTHDAAMLLLLQRLRRLGYHAKTWGLGFNSGDMKKLVPLAIEKALALNLKHSQKVHLLGWSLGGTIAREIAREHPEAVEQVITLGSPVIGGPKYTATAAWYRRKGFDLDRLERGTALREERTPLKVPVTALYDRHDAVVSWTACIDRRSANVQHAEVECSHFGMIVDRQAFALIAQALARQR